MPGCNVTGCSVRETSDIKLNKVPRKAAIRKKWENYLLLNGREEPCAVNFWICDLHFELEVTNDGTVTRLTYPTVDRDEWLKLGIKNAKLQVGTASQVDTANNGNDNFINTLANRITVLENELKRANKKIDTYRSKLRNIKQEEGRFEKNLGKFFDHDQLEMLKGKKFVKWGVKSISKALYIRKKGKQILNFTRAEIAPLPSLTTCNRRLQEIKFSPGVLNFCEDILAEKCKNLPECDRNFGMAFDEMAVIPAYHLDPSTKKYTGYCTLPPNESLATDICAFLVMGLTVRIKQVVAFHLTNKTCDGESLWNFVQQCIARVENRCNIKIREVSFDLGSTNRSLLANAKISLTKKNNIFFISHPNRPEDKLYFFPDATHCSKNINGAFRNHGAKVSKELKNKFNLATLSCSLNDVEKLFKADEKLKFPLAPELSQIVLHPNQFEKMDPKNSMKLHSSEVSTAIDFKFQQLKSSKGKKSTTSFILESLNRLHAIMTSRTGWRVDTEDNKSKYNSDVQYLEWLSDKFLLNVEFSKDDRLVCTKGMRMSIKTLISLSKELFDEGVEEFQPSRLLTDAMENVFSVLRSLVPAPTCVQAAQSLRIYSITSLLLKTTTGKYSWDEDDDSFIDFMDIIPKKAISLHETMEVDSFEFDFTHNATWDEVFANKNDFNSFVFFVALNIGRINSKLKCIDCTNWMFEDNIDAVKNLNGFELLKIRSELNESEFPIPSANFVQFCVNLEFLLMKLSEVISIDNPEFRNCFVKEAKSFGTLNTIHCEKLIGEASSLYVRLRIKMTLHRTEKHKANKYASKSIK